MLIATEGRCSIVFFSKIKLTIISLVCLIAFDSANAYWQFVQRPRYFMNSVQNWASAEEFCTKSVEADVAARVPIAAQSIVIDHIDKYQYPSGTNVAICYTKETYRDGSSYVSGSTVWGYCQDPPSLGGSQVYGLPDGCYLYTPACSSGYSLLPTGECYPWIDDDEAGNPSSECGSGNPIYPLTGSKHQREIVGRWSDITLSVGYDTRSKSPGATSSFAPLPSFGPLWQSSLHKQLAFQTGSGGVIQAVQASRGGAGSISFIRDSTGAYMPHGGIADRLSAVAGGWRYMDMATQTIETYDASGALTATYSAAGGGKAYAYSSSATPATVAPAAGLLLTVQDSYARSVQFTYEAGPDAARIRRIVDPNGGVTTASYDAVGNLANLLWPDSTTRRFVYESSALPWALTGIIDENNERQGTYGYDAQGRATSTERGGGVDRYSVSYSTAPTVVENTSFDSEAAVVRRVHQWQLPQNTVLTKPNGTTVNLGATLINGMPRTATRSQPAGAGCDASTSTFTYDANGNIASKTDFNGSKSCHAHDLSRNLEIIRIEGFSSSDACPTDLGTYTVPAGAPLHKFSTQWHPDWNLPVKQVKPKQSIIDVYNGQPDPTAGNAIASCAPATAVLPDGKPIAVLCKRVEQATTDSAAAPVAGDEPDASFNQVSLLLHMDGAADGVTFPDSSLHARAASTIASPLSTDPTNPKFGSAAGAFTGGYLLYPASSDWDMGAGDFTVEFWAKFNTAAIGSRVFMLGQGDSTGGNQTFLVGKNTDNKLTMGLTTSGVSGSAVGNSSIAANVWTHIALVRSGDVLTLYKDGLVEATAAVSGSVPSRATRFGVGVAGEYTATYGGSYGTKMMGWLDEVRITKGLARYTGGFSVPSKPFGDANGMGSVSDISSQSGTPTGAPQTWTYTYNQYGQMLTARDPRNKLTIYAYYGDTATDHTLGDLQSVTDSTGRVTQYTRYDKSGRPLQSIDANGMVTDTSYTPRGWVKTVAVTPPGATAHITVYDYDRVGQLKKATLPDGMALEYTYDAAHRLTAVKDSAGNSVTYTLDNMGNRTSEDLKDPSGALARNITRVFDALNRAQSATGAAQ